MDNPNRNHAVKTIHDEYLAGHDHKAVLNAIGTSYDRGYANGVKDGRTERSAYRVGAWFRGLRKWWRDRDW